MFTYLIDSLVLFILFISLTYNRGFCDDQKNPKFVVTWQDHFELNEIDTTKWSYETGDGCPNICGWGNNELQYYRDSKKNVRVEDGLLIIEARKEKFGNRGYTSAKLVTKGKADWKYGKLEISARLPHGRGTWPAFWMLPNTRDRGLRWPADGEIDIMEHVGFNQGMIFGTIHTEKYNHTKGTQKSDSIFIEDAHKAFHIYSLIWTEDSLVWYVDDQEYYRINKGDDEKDGWPFDQYEYYLTLNLAVGGNWGGKKGIDDTIWPQQIEVDYVKYYRLVN